ncbi:hypothetical protein [Nocardia stercoris]|uniref:Integral membrane protein n=1 Tax=Nocardia stercoris TaxID=2483361 RepID=A0A3M2L3Z5_9NOCA|nr:hypothetical protein [Nocardia stercoris]RMI29228.1 hypothetical protein EBN03_26110 [Nocardia stercoris]
MIRFLAVLSGLVLTLAVAILLPWAGIPAAVLVVLGWRYRICAVLAVLVAVGVLSFVGTGAMEAAATGLVATTYLLNTATVHAPAGVVPTTVPSVVGAVLFTGAAVAASAAPAHWAWAPLATPILVIVLYAWVIRGLASPVSDEETA